MPVHLSIIETFFSYYDYHFHFWCRYYRSSYYLVSLGSAFSDNDNNNNNNDNNDNNNNKNNNKTDLIISTRIDIFLLYKCQDIAASYWPCYHGKYYGDLPRVSREFSRHC